MKINTLIKLIISLLIVFSYFEISAKPGDLDSSFGENGIVKDFSDGLPNLELRGLAVQKDNKIVVFARYRNSINSNYEIILKRYNPDGSKDIAFGTAGVTIYQTSIKEDCGYSLILDNDENIIFLLDSKTIIKFTNDGKLYKDFGENSKIIFNNKKSYFIKTDKYNKFLVLNWTINSTIDSGFYVYRINPNGTFDSSFGQNGFQSIYFPNGYVIGWDVISLDNKYVICGGIIKGESRSYALARLFENGMVDSVFGINGLVNLGHTNNVADLLFKLLNIGNNIYSLGISSGESGFINTFLFRFSNDGKIDSSFGTNGSMVLSYNYDEMPESLHLQSNNKILISGKSSNFNVSCTYLARYKGSSIN